MQVRPIPVEIKNCIRMYHAIALACEAIPNIFDASKTTVRGFCRNDDLIAEDFWAAGALLFLDQVSVKVCVSVSFSSVCVLITLS